MSRLPLAFLAILTWIGLACATIPHAHGPLPPGLRQEEYDALQFFAARRMNCSAWELVYERFGEGRHLFKGCDDVMEMLLLKGSDGEVYGARRGFIMQAPSYGFSKRFACDPRRTTQQRVDPGTRIVEGCGQRVTYITVCNPGCSWIESAEPPPGK